MLWLLPLAPLAAAVALALVHPADRSVLVRAAASALGATLLLALSAVLGGWSGAWVWGPGLRLEVALVPLSTVVAITVPAVALPIAVYAAMHEARAGLARLIALLIAFVGAMELLIAAADLLTLLIAWELVGACSWALISHQWRDAAKPAAARYAFVLTRLGDLGLFVAAMAAFAGTNSFAYASLGQLDGSLHGVVAGGVLIAAAAKSAQVPFAPWLFRAMAGPTSVSALLHAAAMVAAGAYLLARLQPALAPVPWFGPAAIGMGLATALAGGMVASVQADAKKLLAASTSAQYGLMFVATGAGYPAVAILHLVAHAAYKAPLFLAAGIAEAHTGSFRLADMGLGRVMPGIAALTAVAAAALAGVPPLGGAWTKEAVVAAAGHASPAIAAAVAVAGGLSALYATRFAWLAFGAGAPDRHEAQAPAPNRIEIASLAVLAGVTLLLSVLWLSPVNEPAGALLGTEFPASPRWELALSLAMVALGVYAGWLLVRAEPALGSAGAPAAFSDWFGLPALLHAVLGRPGRVLARAAARLDDEVVDAVPRSIAAFGRRLAALGGGLAETWVDGLPGGLARLVGLGATDLRQLQTGMTQHYYAAIAVGVAVLTIILLWGGR